jgi:hypothetical protein
MQPFYVINYNTNKQIFEPYNIMKHFISEYKKLKKKPKTIEEIKEFIEKESVHTYWSRTEYEIILIDWPCQKHEEKWDIYKQILMNIDIIIDIFIKNIKSK